MTEIKNLAAEFKIKAPDKMNPDNVVLVIEDQQDIRLIVTHHLNKMGFKKIQQASSGLEAVEFLKTFGGRISVVICSYEIPDMSGVEFLAEIQESPECQRGPFAIAMGSPSEEKIMLANENGVDEIMVKPFTLKDVLPKMQRAFTAFNNPNNPELVYELAKACLREGKLKEATHIYEKLGEATETAARPFVGLARTAVKTNELEKALTYLETAEKRNPNYVHLFEQRGRILATLKRHDEALVEFKKAIDLSPLNPVRYESAAEILFELKKFEEAVELLNLAVKQELRFPSLHHYLSQGYYALKDFKKAIKHIRSALNMEPENVTYLNQLGISYKESKDYQEAARTYNSIIKLDPENKAALCNKAVLSHTTGAVADAVKILKRVCEKFPDFAPAKAKLAEYQKAPAKEAS